MKPKFRAYDIHGKKMFTNDQLIIWNGNVYANDNSKLNVDNLKGWNIDEKYLMQTTGLKDKNGNEIFEGDIVVNQHGSVGYVAYLKQEAGFVVVLKKSDYRLGHRNTGESYDVTNNHKVIGNVYENPELVEGE